MTRKKEEIIEGNGVTSEVVSDTINDTVQPTQLILKFDDLSVSKSGGVVTISKMRSGISDSTYSNVAVGATKNWQLFNEVGSEIPTGNIHGNRPFFWRGELTPGLYTLTTGPGYSKSAESKVRSRIPGRGYSVTFWIF